MSVITFEKFFFFFFFLFFFFFFTWQTKEPETWTLFFPDIRCDGHMQSFEKIAVLGQAKNFVNFYGSSDING